MATPAELTVLSVDVVDEDCAVYDIQVEDDHSFIVAGAVLHNSEICRARDGKIYPIDSGPRPPAHPNCRSTTAPVLKSWESLARPGALKPERDARRIDDLFRERLADKGFTPEQIAKIERDTRASMNGQVAGDLDYSSWLRRQPVAMQNEVMGVTKAALFRKGEIDADRFVDLRTAEPFTLDDLRRRERAAWARAFGSADVTVDEAIRMASARNR